MIRPKLHLLREINFSSRACSYRHHNDFAGLDPKRLKATEGSLQGSPRLQFRRCRKPAMGSYILPPKRLLRNPYPRSENIFNCFENINEGLNRSPARFDGRIPPFKIIR
jgi:hypothetical protein